LVFSLFLDWNLGFIRQKARVTFYIQFIDTRWLLVCLQTNLFMNDSTSKFFRTAKPDETRTPFGFVELFFLFENSGDDRRQPALQQPPAQPQTHLLDLLDVNITTGTASGWVDPWGTPAHPSEPPAPVMPPRPKVTTKRAPQGAP